MENDNKYWCFYCYNPLTDNNRTRDHIKPKSHGNTLVKNKVYCCRNCNQSKANLTFKEWLEKINKSNDYKTLTRKNYIIGTIYVMIDKYGYE